MHVTKCAVHEMVSIVWPPVKPIILISSRATAACYRLGLTIDFEPWRNCGCMWIRIMTRSTRSGVLGVQECRGLRRSDVDQGVRRLVRAEPGRRKITPGACRRMGPLPLTVESHCWKRLWTLEKPRQQFLASAPGLASGRCLWKSVMARMRH